MRVILNADDGVPSEQHRWALDCALIFERQHQDRPSGPRGGVAYALEHFACFVQWTKARALSVRLWVT